MQIRDPKAVRKLLILTVICIAAGFILPMFFPKYQSNIICAIFGTAMVIISFAAEGGSINKIENCSYVTSGIITDHYVQVDTDGPDSYFPIYEYSYGGQKYTARSTMSARPDEMHIGREVDVYLNPDKPEESYIAEVRKSSKTFITLFRLFGVLFVLLSFLFH